MNNRQARDLDHFLQYGDVYETIDTCRELEMMLARLKRLRLLSEQEWNGVRQHVTHIRTRLEGHLAR